MQMVTTSPILFSKTHLPCFNLNFPLALSNCLVENKFFFKPNMCSTLRSSIIVPFVKMIDVHPLDHGYCVCYYHLDRQFDLHVFDSYLMHQHHKSCAKLPQYNCF